MTRIRPATVFDVPWLLDQLRAFDDFFGTKRSLFPSDAAARGILETLITAQVFLIAERNGVAVGFITGTLAPHPFNPAIRVLSEVFWWVEPEHRGTAAGARLLDAFLGHGRLHADWIVMTLEQRTIDEGMVDPASLASRGFKLHEQAYLLELTPARESPSQLPSHL